MVMINERYAQNNNLFHRRAQRIEAVVNASTARRNGDESLRSASAASRNADESLPSASAASGNGGE